MSNVHRLSLSLVALSLAGGPALSAQTPDARCGGSGGSALPGGNACQLAVDLLTHMGPQLGVVTAGGNPTLGQGGTLKGLGHFALVLRVTAAPAFGVPDLSGSTVGEGGVTRGSYATIDDIGGLPGADLELGLFRGVALGPVRVLGVDALASAIYTPEDGSALIAPDADFVRFADERMSVSYGVRVGMLEETRFAPGVALTYTQRKLPSLSFLAAVPGAASGAPSGEPGAAPPSDSIGFEALSVRTRAWRVAAGKRLWILGLVAGAGQDRYSTQGDATYALYGADGLTRTAGRLPVSRTITRTNVFANASLNLFLFTLVGEVGRVSGGGAATYNTFSSDGGAPQTYGSVGLRFGR